LRSIHNVCIERLWRDVRKDTLEVFRQIFLHLTETGLLDMENPIHRRCLYLVFQPRIQKSLDRSREAWNHHKIRTAGNQTPVALYELSRAKAIRLGYWTGDPGDSVEEASNPMYGVEDLLGSQESAEDQNNEDNSSNEEEELANIRDILGDFDLERADGNWGIDVYLEAILVVQSYLDGHQ
jgi:hypothetical protein